MIEDLEKFPMYMYVITANFRCVCVSCRSLTCLRLSPEQATDLGKSSILNLHRDRESTSLHVNKLHHLAIPVNAILILK